MFEYLSIKLMTSLPVGAGWKSFTDTLNSFKNGLSEANGAGNAIAWTLIVVGVVGAAVSFAVHRFASRPPQWMPSWFIMLCIAAFGTVVKGGISEENPLVKLVIAFGNWILSFFGI